MNELEGHSRSLVIELTLFDSHISVYIAVKSIRLFCTISDILPFYSVFATAHDLEESLYVTVIYDCLFTSISANADGTRDAV